MAVSERRRAPECTCGAQGADYGDPHREGCPRYRDRSRTFFVLDALRRRYTGDGEWLFFEEWKRVDAFAIRCWGSGIGNRRIAFEVKTSRADFLSELRRPMKREFAMDVSHQFFFATPKGLVDGREIPHGCGLIEVDEKARTKIAVHAPVRSPRALKMSEAISLMRAPLYKGGILQLRREVLLTEGAAAHDRKRARGMEERLRFAERMLELHAGAKVEKGSLWKGLWNPHSWVKPSAAPVAVYVEKIEERSPTMTAIEVRRLDGADFYPWTFYSRGSFLSRFEPYVE